MEIGVGIRSFPALPARLFLFDMVRRAKTMRIYFFVLPMWYC